MLRRLAVERRACAFLAGPRFPGRQCAAFSRHPREGMMTQDQAEKRLRNLVSAAKGAGVQPKVVVPDGSTKRLPDAPEKPAVELKGFAKMRALIREHGFSFIALYTGGYFVTYVPIFAALQVGGVNGPELCISAAEWMQLSYDITWIRDSTISKELVNAFIAAELNGWLEVVRLPLVVVSAPKMTAWIAKQRGP